ncbi:DUF2188 domain-containing protein [Agromyces mediolanus]|uniref:DUF2188 domain-containing protein n=1 Tax=Agromyces mediolanus TaxID=41986 RepID=UPI00203A859B|nr:DUF2188 domain-containing protein [Agromyces mediolanus]MCM3658832.1 DUF2188 domain-containing protein [Agromyces mediolanus]
MPQEYRYDIDLVRLMYDYTDSVVWFPDPVDYDASALSAELVAELRAWGELHEKGLDEDFNWRSPDYPDRIDRERQQLAHRLGDELGEAFEVEFDVPHRVWFGPRTAHYRSNTPATNPAAAAYFASLAVAAAEERASWQAQAAAGPWFAHQPLSGELFLPDDGVNPVTREPAERIVANAGASASAASAGRERAGMAQGEVVTRSNRGQWENEVEGEPERSQSFASREEAITAGRELAALLGTSHTVIESEPTGVITDEGPED